MARLSAHGAEIGTVYFMPIRLRPTHTSRCAYAIYPVGSHTQPCHIKG